MKKQTMEQYAREQYDKFGDAYQKSRDKRQTERLYNDCYEVPSMIAAVGNVKGKVLLDVGCGAGIHAIAYKKKGAKVFGCDISSTMIQLAQQRCTGIPFDVCNITKMPYKKNQFDVVTASLIVHYIDDLEKAFLEVGRVLKKGGLFYFSTDNEVQSAREFFENEHVKARAVGYVYDKMAKRKIPLGVRATESIHEYEMVPGMIVKGYTRPLRTYLQSVVKSGFELVDVIDCQPNTEFKKRDPETYALLKKVPMFAIYVCRKKQ